VKVGTVLEKGKLGDEKTMRGKKWQRDKLRGGKLPVIEKKNRGRGKLGEGKWHRTLF